MQVTAERPKPCEVELKIEVGTDKVAQAIDTVYRELAKTTSVPGFRKGKVPRKILERYVSPESVRQRAVEIMVPQAYQDALEQEDIQPYADPELEIVQFEADQPFIFKATVPLPPTVELGEYKGIEVQRPQVTVTDEDIDTQLKYLQESRASTEKVEGRGIQQDDIVVAEVSSQVEGEEKSSPRRSLIEVGSNVEGFDENILGMESGQRRTFAIRYPEDYGDERLAGKNVEFDISVEAIRERHVPELNDEFAKSLGEFETLADLREEIKNRLTKSREESAESEVEEKIVNEIVARSKVCYPEVLVEHEMHHDIEDLMERLERQGLTIDQYLERTGRSRDDLLAEYREAAERRLRTGLVLGEIIEKEGIEVSDEEVQAEVDRMIAESKASAEAVEQYIEATGGRKRIRNSLLTRKVLDYLKSVSVIN